MCTACVDNQCYPFADAGTGADQCGTDPPGSVPFRKSLAPSAFDQHSTAPFIFLAAGTVLHDVRTAARALPRANLECSRLFRSPSRFASPAVRGWMTPQFWEQIWEHNPTKPPEITPMQFEQSDT